MVAMTIYDDDFYSWTQRQADALRRRSGNEIDWDNLAEEIESLGKSQAAELRSRYITLLLHLLKWRFQPDRRSRSWEATIRRERREIDRHLSANPGLKSRRAALFADAYKTARIDASGETDMAQDVFPETSPFTLAQAKAENFWPEA